MKPQVTEAHRALASRYCNGSIRGQEFLAYLIAQHDAELLARAEAAEAANLELITAGNALQEWLNYSDAAQARDCDKWQKVCALAPAETRSVIAGLRLRIEELETDQSGILAEASRQVEASDNLYRKMCSQRDALIAAGDHLIKKSFGPPAIVTTMEEAADYRDAISAWDAAKQS